jgi:hypothetical protein
MNPSRAPPLSVDMGMRLIIEMKMVCACHERDGCCEAECVMLRQLLAVPEFAMPENCTSEDIEARAPWSRRHILCSRKVDPDQHP